MVYELSKGLILGALGGFVLWVITTKEVVIGIAGLAIMVAIAGGIAHLERVHSQPTSS